MPLDHYVTLGRSGLRVSPLCLGAMTFGEDLGWGSSVEESEAIIDRYIELGGNFIDTANVYTKGHSEKIIGDHVGKERPKRNRLVIATKFSSNLHVGDPNGGGSNRKSIISACEESLRRLQTDYIDLYWLHNWDKHTPIEETMAALKDLVRAGKVRYLGVSDTPAWKVSQAQTIAQFRGWAPFIGLQIEYSLLERTVEGELIPMARELGLGVTPWSPLKGGVSAASTRVRTPVRSSPIAPGRRAICTTRPMPSSTSCSASPGISTRPSLAWRWRGCRAGRASSRRSSARARWRSSRTTSRRSRSRSAPSTRPRLTRSPNRRSTSRPRSSAWPACSTPAVRRSTASPRS
jgi:aryl-alcohol dehydrogenase-like predicted oxidoreductase